MAAVNWLCLVVLAFAFINNNVCIKVDPNEANGNYTTINNLNSQTIQQHKSSSSDSSSNEPDNITLLGDSELSASERTRRLIPYMAFYVPVADFPINKQYANSIQQTTKQQVARPTSTTGSGTGPTAQQYVHLKVTAPTASGHIAEPYLPPSSSSSSQVHYHPSAGEVYHTLAYGGQPEQQQQFHILTPPSGIKNIDNGIGGIVGNNKYPGQSHRVVHPGPPGPSATAALSSSVVGKGNAYVPYKEINPIRHKTVQHFPPLTSTSSTSSASSSPSSGSSYETIRQQQQQTLHGINGGVYRPRTKQSKINLTPFTPSNTVPGNFVPIVYTPLNNNNNNNNYNGNSNNNKVITSQATSPVAAAGASDDIILNEDEKQYHKQQQQIAIEYSSAPLPPSSAASSSTVDIQQPSLLLPPHRHHNSQYHHHLQQQQQQQHQQNYQQHNHHHHHNPKQSQYFSVTTSPLSAANVDLTHEVGVATSNSGGGGGVADGAIALGNAAANAQSQHHQNTQAISSPPTIYHQQQQPEHVIIDASLRPSQTLTLIGSKQQQQQHQHQQQKQQYHSKPPQFQPPKPESFFESEQQHKQQQQHHNIDQVLKDVNSYDTKNSQMTTPQEKYVMYLQHQIRYNKHQLQLQHQHTTRQKIREHKEREQPQQQQQYVKQHHNAQIFVLSSTASPHHDAVAVTALSPIRTSSSQNSHFSPNYPQNNQRHVLYSRPDYNSHDLPPPPSPHSQQLNTGEQIVTIPVRSLFSELDTLQHNHYAQSQSSHNSQYPKKIGPSTPQYIDYVIDEPKQSLDDEQNPPRHHHQQQPLELLKPTLGPPSHAFILVSTAAPFVHDAAPVVHENYGSTLRPPYKSKPKIRLQPVIKEKNVNYPINRQPNPTGRPQLAVSITPTPNAIIDDDDGDENSKPKYVYVKEEFGQKLSAIQSNGAVKLKPSNKYESDNKIPQEQLLQHNVALQPLAPRPPIPTILTDKGHYQQHEQQTEEEIVVVQPPKTILADPNELPDIRTSSLAEILHKLQESNHLPHTLTPDNIDNSIKTLIRILNNLKQTQTIVANPPQHHETPSSPHADYDYTTGSEEQQQQHPKHQHPEQHTHQQEHPVSFNDLSSLSPSSEPNKHPGPSTGRPGIDYPNYAEIPQTSFDCSEQRYKGFFGDPETNCQVWHYCDLNGGKASFLCPNGTIFSQIALTCDWWFNVKCGTTTQLYVLNERLYKYILPFTPKFPEDYSGPLVDKYLAMKFQEMEEKMRVEKEKLLQEEEAEAATEQQHQETTSEDSKEDNHLEEETTTTTEDTNKHRQLKSPSSPSAAVHKPESVNSQVSEQSSERNLLIDDEVDDISQRGTIDTFDSTTIATITASVKPVVSFNLKPIIVSSTIGPDYDEEQLQHHEDNRRQAKEYQDLLINKTEIINDTKDQHQETVQTSTGDKMQITVEKVDVIEIKPDGATGHLIRDMLLNSNQKM